MARDAERLASDVTASAYFLPKGEPITVGATLVNPAYAISLAAVAKSGAVAIYTGDIAADIVAAVTLAPGNPCVLSVVDLAIY